MEQGYYETKQIFKGYKEEIEEHKDELGNLLYTTNSQIPIYEEIKTFIPYTDEEIIDNLRSKRESECFSVINRGKLWYDTLTEKQLNELQQWYNDWLDVTETKVIPTKPSWIK